MNTNIGLAPLWAHSARILGVRYDELDRLREFAESYAASVVILYLVPEMSNGWCPQGTYAEIADFVEEAHRWGLKVLGYFDSSTADEAFYTGVHQDWVQRNSAGKPQYYRPRHISQGRHCYERLFAVLDSEGGVLCSGLRRPAWIRPAPALPCRPSTTSLNSRRWSGAVLDDSPPRRTRTDPGERAAAVSLSAETYIG